MVNNDCVSVGAVGKVSALRLALSGDRLWSTTVLVLALALYSAQQPVDGGVRFHVKQARKCERGVELRNQTGFAESG